MAALELAEAQWALRNQYIESNTYSINIATHGPEITV